jgi:hypothetical protein
MSKKKFNKNELGQFTGGLVAHNVEASFVFQENEGKESLDDKNPPTENDNIEESENDNHGNTENDVAEIDNALTDSVTLTSMPMWLKIALIIAGLFIVKKMFE